MSLDEDQMAAIVSAVMQQVVPQVVSSVVERMTAPEAPPADTTPPDPSAEADRLSVIVALEEKARWEAMSADELAEHEAAAARTRYTDAIVDVLGRDGDPAVLDDLAAALPADAVTACRSDARKRLAGNATAQAAIDGGLKSRRDVLDELITAITSGKATGDQRRQFADLIAR